jgi:cyclic pyranopterin phosphate synthase
LLKQVEGVEVETEGAAAPHRSRLRDTFGRDVTYLRLSVTDRCDLRCLYCMTERMEFLPKAEVLSLEELDRLTSAFIGLGVRKVRLTGGEPLVRRDVMRLVRALGRHLESGALEELTLTTNGVRLAEFAGELYDAGVRRVNVSLDSLDRETFARIARRDVLGKVLGGIEAARDADLNVKINTVALARDNRAELPRIIQWAHEHGHDATLIETMPLGAIDEDRMDEFLPLSRVREDLASFWTLIDLPDRTGGPARYVRVKESGGRLGFITPLTHNFCESCNRVRVTCTGTIYTCLGQDHHLDLRAVMRAHADDVALRVAILEAIKGKPRGHDFVIERREARPALARFMSTTGG